MPPKAPESLALPFESSQAEIAGVRLLPSQLARLLGVSKQAVSEWVKAGRVVLGVDGRVDPNKAVADLMRTGDPRRLRAKLLAPLAADMRARDARIAALEERVAALGLELAAANEDADFNQSAAADYCEIFDTLQAEIAGAWSWLRERPDGADLVRTWLDVALRDGADRAGDIADYLPAPGVDGEGRRKHQADNQPAAAGGRLTLEHNKMNFIRTLCPSCLAVKPLHQIADAIPVDNDLGILDVFCPHALVGAEILIYAGIVVSTIRFDPFRDVDQFERFNRGAEGTAPGGDPCRPGIACGSSSTKALR